MSFDPGVLHGISFFDANSNRQMRYIYPDAGHWCAGWVVVKNPSGEWMTLRKATDADIAVISKAVVAAHHAGEDGAPAWKSEGKSQESEGNSADATELPKP